MDYTSEYFTVVMYIAFFSYLLGSLLYLKKIPELISSSNYIKLFGNLILVVGFLTLTFFTYTHARDNLTIKEKTSEHNIIGSPSNYGYVLLAMYSALAFLLPFDVHITYYFIFSLLGYTLLSIREVAGIYLLIIFYALSVIITLYYKGLNLTLDEVVTVVNKLGLLMYFGSYGFYYAIKNKGRAFRNLIN